MSYDFSKTKKKQFNAIEKDKQSLNLNTSKIANTNSAFGSVSLNKLMPSFINENVDVEYVDLELISPRSVNDFSNNSIETLKQSIDNVGLFFPILLRTKPDGRYIIISGHRRYRAVKELLSEYKIKKAQAEQQGKDITIFNRKIDQLSKIKATLFTVVEDDSELLGTSPKYITKAQEEEIYIASNAENRANTLEGKSGYLVVKYFYQLIKDSIELQEKLMNQANATASRKSNKLNFPKVISKLITNDLGYNVAPSYIWQIITIIEDSKNYPKYQKIAIKRLEDGEKTKTVFSDYELAAAINNFSFPSDEQELKEEYSTRIEKGKEKITHIYDEFAEYYEFQKKNKSHEKKNDKVSKDKVIEIMKKIISGEITAKNALSKIEKL